MKFSDSPSADEGLIPTVFQRYNRRLRGLLIERQAWFVLRDLAKLTNSHLGERVTSKLDPDQLRHERLAGCEEKLYLVSESGLYALLMVHFYHPENRSLRQWLSNEVLPALRDAQQHNPHLPQRRMEQVEGHLMSVMDWQGKLWVRWSDALRMMEDQVRSLH
ncbi:Bro-N domain-containing protein [Pseudomonas sp. GD04087]|uniref:BRO-N domain-containing protein n=1 Tax=unclassified Pseudomonas TaxID=196821 RepID=UPI00244CE551|nr:MULTISPECIES: Bro-N domain-containing protein [unclassified Pseudomonas]MDH0290793.1 Bro-N domain-containing protein [Pseudomonas sp. GD04087]MDH1051800.1 Bro-N domain-containing protein [Pseudomonas sp. GD03903]MDH2002405.1 Bro-N domain-containing protein [Pseudomonas sp. GD03691]